MESVKRTVVRLWPSAVVLAGGGLSFGLPGFAVCAILLAISDLFQYLQNAKAMDCAHAVAMAKRSSDADAIAARLSEIDKQLKLLATPEKVELFQKFAEHARKFGLGGRG